MEVAESKRMLVSAVIPTRNRNEALRRTLESLAKQSQQPDEIIIIDASDNRETESLCQYRFQGMKAEVRYVCAKSRGAASQRNEGVAVACAEFILFIDDDLTFEDNCIERLFRALKSDPGLGGVNAMITNQKYHPPGLVSRVLYQYLNGQHLDSYAGKCLGPVMNLLPDDNESLPDVVPVEWLNTTCTLYRKAALPDPPFPDFFTGYSMFEDVTISVTVGRSWKLANVRNAKVYHDSQPGDHKNSLKVLSKMELVNRYYVMTRILNRRGLDNMIKLAVTELYKVTSYLQSLDGIKQLPAVMAGKFSGVIEIFKTARHAA